MTKKPESGNAKRICMITTIPATMEMFVVDSMRYFKKRNFDITLVSSMNTEFHNRYCSEFECVDVQMVRGVDLRNSISAILSMANLFRERKFDIVQYATPNAAFCASIAAFLARVPVRIYCQWGVRYVGFAGLKRKIFKIIEFLTCRLSTHIRPVSKKNMEFAVEEKLYKNKKARVVGAGGTIGVDLGKYDVGRKKEWRKKIITEFSELEGKTVVGFVGRVVADKGVNELITSFREILKVKKNLFLLIIGDFEERLNPVRTDLFDWARKSGNVMFTGHIENVNEYMSVMDILVQPSYREGFSMVIQQAQAMGVAVVTTDIPGPSEVIEERKTGVLVPPRDSTSLENAMMELLQDKQKIMKMGSNGVLRARRLFERKKMVRLIYKDRIGTMQKAI